jgi:hypothetical protein
MGSWDGAPGEILAADRNMTGGVRVPVGIGTVVPVEKLIQVIQEDEVMKKQRGDVRKQYDESIAANQDTAFAAISTTESNPAHQEDFNRLVSAASKRKPKGDRT